MSEELLFQIAQKYGINKEILTEIIECERKQVHKERRQINGTLKEIVNKAVKEAVCHDR
jgi:hypothetical protein